MTGTQETVKRALRIFDPVEPNSIQGLVKRALQVFDPNSDRNSQSSKEDRGSKNKELKSGDRKIKARIAKKPSIRR
jgi:hypothetical protein